MHMSDALVSTTVGGMTWGATALLVAWSARRVKAELDERKVPLMGVMGAFVFAAQMINFAIPGTGSSGHLGGGLLLAVLLGPHAAFLTLFSVLAIQALLFGDGGLLALGANAFNLGFFPCFVAYPLLYLPMAKGGAGRSRGVAAALVAAVVGLMLGALAVVLETTLSGIAELPFTSFLLLMLPIHLAIGVVEGLATAGILGFLATAGYAGAMGRGHGRFALVAMLALSLVTGALLSLMASDHPDGLEWAIAGVSGGAEVDPPETPLHEGAAAVQERTALLPDYAMPTGTQGEGASATGAALVGLIGTLVTLLGIGSVAIVLRRRES
jgi:cobalt/nickel transport system permease protein